MSKKLPRTWEPGGPEETLLRRIWPDHTISEVVEKFKTAGYRDRTRTSIERKSRALSLKKTEEGRRKSYVGRQFADVSALEKLDWLPTFDKFHTVHSECATVYSDPHIPYVDMGLARKMCAISKKMKCTDLILGGDTFNQDMFSHFIRYLGVEKGEVDATWSFELEAVSEFLKMVLDTFQHVWVTRGNHDERILRLLMGKVGLRHIFKWLDEYDSKRVHVSEYPYCYLMSGARKFRITHPKSYSKIPTRVSSWLASKWECSIMSAHGHRQGWVFSDSGHCAIDIGGGFDPKKIEYINMNDTTHGKWNPGFFVVRRGFPYPFSRDWTDWDYWLRGKGK
jgi:hypothetical protein